MIEPLQLIRANELMAMTSGIPEIAIALIDGPIDVTHPDFQNTQLQAATYPGCQASESLACHHGTFIAGMLGAQRVSEAPALCPDCRFFVRPIFCETTGNRPCPEVTPKDLSVAIRDSLEAGVQIINLSLGLAASRLLYSPELQVVFDRALQQGILVVVAAGNLKQMGPVPLFHHPWIIPIATCNQQGHLTSESNIGLSIGRQGLMAPGVDIVSTAAGGGYTTMSGTSVAAPFVTGVLALLWSLYPQATAAEIRQALLRPDLRRRSVVPPLLNVTASWQHLAQESLQPLSLTQ